MHPIKSHYLSMTLNDEGLHFFTPTSIYFYCSRRESLEINHVTKNLLKNTEVHSLQHLSPLFGGQYFADA
jgi:hypothetical protein